MHQWVELKTNNVFSQILIHKIWCRKFDGSQCWNTLFCILSSNCLRSNMLTICLLLQLRCLVVFIWPIVMLINTHVLPTIVMLCGLVSCDSVSSTSDWCCSSLPPVLPSVKTLASSDCCLSEKSLWLKTTKCQWLEMAVVIGVVLLMLVTLLIKILCK